MQLSKLLVIGAAAATIVLVMAAPSHAQQWSPQNTKPPPVANPRPVAPTVRDHRTTATPTVRDHRKTEATVRDHRQDTRKRGNSDGAVERGAKVVAGAATAPVRGAVNAGSKVVGGAKKGLKTAVDVLNPFD